MRSLQSRLYKNFSFSDSQFCIEYLTKYYGKDIRMKNATCLIVDEVDSMCIDNMCNTLYISHQIADLRYMSDIFVYIWQAVNAHDTGIYSIQNVKKVYYFNKR